ncbi:MAG: multicopper oxidase family protein [Myxococcaceae bacterium]
MAPPIAQDLDPDPEVVRVELEAREDEWEIASGCRVRAATINGSVPGPTLQARVGQLLKVQVTNNLSEVLTLHWHGLQVASHLDGTEVIQRGIPPGATFEYSFRVGEAGTFWYHPHPHTNGSLASERGLYGAVIFRDEGEPTLDGEKVLLLDEASLERMGWLPGSSLQVGLPRGRADDLRIVNGRAHPALRMAAGTIERWRIINVSFSSCMRLSIGGEPFQILGTDGGFLSWPVKAWEVLLAPGNRIDLAVGPFAEGSRVHIHALPLAPGEPAGDFATVRVGPHRKSHGWVPKALKRIERLVPSDTVVVVNQTVRLSGPPAFRRPRFFGEGSVPHHIEPVRVGTVQVWDVVNEGANDQAFHLHGFFFQVLDVNGVEPPFNSWADTCNVPAGGRVRIAWLPEDRPGSWLFHCHVLSSESGPAHFDILRPDEEPRMLSHLY